MRHGRIGFLLAAVFALALGSGVVVSPPAQADDGSFARGVPQSTWPTVADQARATQLASKMVQDVLRELYRTSETAYQDGCTSNGFLCAAGTGFNVNIGAGWCWYDYATGADATHSSYRVLRLGAAEAATAWAANPGANTYYVHVGFGEATAGGIEAPDPVVTVDTDATLAGTLTVCSVVVAGAEPSAATYTYNDLRTVLPGLIYTPGDKVIAGDLDVGGDLQVDGAANVTGDLSGGPDGGPQTYGVDVATGAPTFGPGGGELAGVDPVTGTFYVGNIGAEGMTCTAAGVADFATTIATAGGTGVPVSAFYDDISTGGCGAAGAGLLPVSDGATGVAWGTTVAASYGAETVLAAALAADDGVGGDAAAGTVPLSDGAGGADWATLATTSFGAEVVLAAALGADDGAGHDAAAGTVPVADGAGGADYATLGAASIATGAVGSDEIANGAVAPIDAAVVTGTIGLPFMIEAECVGAADPLILFNANAPFAFRITDFWCIAAAANGAGATAQLHSGAAGISNALDLNVGDTTVVRAGTIDDATYDVAAGGSLQVDLNAAGTLADCYVVAVRK